MKILNGRELAGFIKERQRAVIGTMSRPPRLLIIRDSDNPVIKKYVDLKKSYGEDIGVVVEDFFAKSEQEICEKIRSANQDEKISGIIVQLPLKDRTRTDEITAMIASEKDVDGLSGSGKFDSATATAINWLLAGFDINLKNQKIAIVGRGKLVGAPLYRMWHASGFDVSIFHSGDDLNELKNFTVIVTATGHPHLIKSSMVSPGTTLVDAGTASEDGVLVGDLDDELRSRSDLSAITPRLGGVGPLTISCLFEHVISSVAKNS